MTPQGHGRRMRQAPPSDDGLWTAILFSAPAGSVVAGTIVTIPDRAVSLTVATVVATLRISARPRSRPRSSRGA